MSELVLVALIIGSLIVLSVVGQLLPPRWVVIGVLIGLNAINFFIVIINVIQAIKRDQRFLHSGYLGLITLGVGIVLLGILGVIWGLDMVTYLASVPFIVGGFVTLIAVAIVSLSKR